VTFCGDKRRQADSESRRETLGCHPAATVATVPDLLQVPILSTRDVPYLCEQDDANLIDHLYLDSGIIYRYR
jgi:hypothetical protein